jgi:toxin ParE1/3/4
MNYEVKVTRQAYGQIREIALYIANDCCAPEAAQNLLDKLEASINDLAEMPKRHLLVDKEPWRSAGVRKVTVKNFLIYFWVDEENMKVLVTGVIYEKRDQLARLAEMDWE